MKRIYAIVINDLAKEREFKLSNLLGEECNTESGSWYVTKSMNTHKAFTDKAKTYRTIKGALKEVNRCNKAYDNKQIALPSSEVVNGYYTSYFKFETSKYTFSYIDVTEKWNKFVSDNIDREVLRHETEMTKLKKKLVL